VWDAVGKAMFRSRKGTPTRRGRSSLQQMSITPPLQGARTLKGQFTERRDMQGGEIRRAQHAHTARKDTSNCNS
jgi:hypothetical protein